MRLGEEWLSTSGEPDSTHWRQVFLPLENPLQVTGGEQLSFALKRPEFGEWTWTNHKAGVRQRLSTFMSQPLTPERLHKASDNYQPTLSNRGEAARWLLAQMTGEYATGQLAARLCEYYPETFVTEVEALKFVKDQVRRFS